MKIFFSSLEDLSIMSAQRTHILELARNFQKLRNDVHVFARNVGSTNCQVKGLVFHNVSGLNVKKLCQVSYTLISIAKMLMFSLTSKPQVIYERHCLFDPGIFVAKLLRVPIILEVNGLMVDEERMAGISSHFKLKFAFEKFAFRNVNSIVSVTSGIANELVKRYSVLRNKIFVVPCGVNLDAFEPLNKKECRRKLGLPLENPLLCFVGSLSPWSCLNNIIEALPYVIKENPEANFLLVGGYPPHLLKEYKEIVRKLGLEKSVIFTEMVDHDLIPLYINASDVCFCLRCGGMVEGFSPIKLYEYMACGKAVIASDEPGLNFLKKINAGVVVDPSNIEEMSSEINRLLSDPEMRKEMGNNSRRYVTERHSWENIARRIAQIMRDTLRRAKYSR